MEHLETVLSVPGPYSAALLAIDPHYEVLQGDPRFAELGDGGRR